VLSNLIDTLRVEASMLKSFKTSSTASLISIVCGASSCLRSKPRIRRMTSLALIVFANVGKDVPHFVQRRRVSRKEHLGRLGVAEDRTERLVEFMGDRRSQFTDGGDPCYMSEFFAIPLKLHPRPASSHSLQQQACDHCHLEGKNKQRTENGPSILLPQRGRSKSNDTVRWQSAFSDPPSFQGPPIEHRHR